MNTLKTALIMEGGAMRGMFTCGVIDVLLENNIAFIGAAGISAGAVFVAISNRNRSGERSDTTRNIVKTHATVASVPF